MRQANSSRPKYLKQLIDDLFQSTSLRGIMQGALANICARLSADYGVILCCTSSLELVNIETYKLTWRPAAQIQQRLGQPKDTGHKAKVHFAQEFVKRCLVLTTGNGVFEREKGIRSHVNSKGRDAFVFHRLFNERFYTYCALPLTVSGELLGEVVVAFARDTQLSRRQRALLQTSVDIVALAMGKLDKDVDLRSGLELLVPVYRPSSSDESLVSANLPEILENLTAYIGASSTVLRDLQIHEDGHFVGRNIAGFGEYYRLAGGAAFRPVFGRNSKTAAKLRGGQPFELQCRQRELKLFGIECVKHPLGLANYWETVDALLIVPLNSDAERQAYSYLELHIGRESLLSAFKLGVLSKLSAHLSNLLQLDKSKQKNLDLIREKRDHLECLSGLCWQILKLHSFEKYKDFAAEVTCGALRAEIATIFIYDKKEALLRREAWWPRYQNLKSVREEYLRGGKRRGITGRVFRCKEGESVWINSGRDIGRGAVSEHLDAYRCLPSWRTVESHDCPVSHLLAAPIIGENGKVFGALRVMNKKSMEYSAATPILSSLGFTESDKSILESLASVVALAISNQRRAERLEILEGATKKISESDSLGNLASNVAETITREMCYSACNFRYLRNDQLVYLGGSGFESDIARDSAVFAADQGLTGRALKTGKPAYAKDILSDKFALNQGYHNREFAHSESLRGACVVPVRGSERKSYGTIAVYMRKHPYEFLEYERKILDTIGRSTSITLKKIEAMELVEHSRQRLSKLVEILELITSGSSTDDSGADIVAAVFGEVLEILGGDAGAVFKIVEYIFDGNGRKRIWDLLYSQNIVSKELCPANLLEDAVSHGPEVLRCSSFAELESVYEEGFEYGSIFLARSIDTVVGAFLILNRKDPSGVIKFGERERLAGVIGRQLARSFMGQRFGSAKVGARVAGKIADESDSSIDFGLGLSKTDNSADTGVDEFRERLWASFRRIIGFSNSDIGYVALLRKDSEDICPELVHGVSRSAIPRLKIGGNSLTGWVYRKARMYLWPGGEIDEWYVKYKRVEKPIESEIVLPMRYRNQVVGLLVLSSFKKNAYNAALGEIAQMLADEMAVDIQNNVFFLAAIRLSEVSFDSLEARKVCEQLARAANAIMNTPVSCVWLKEAREKKTVLSLEGWDGVSIPDRKDLEMDLEGGGISWSVVNRAETVLSEKRSGGLGGDALHNITFDIQDPEVGFRHLEFARKHSLRSMISMPLVWVNEVVGVINAYSRRLYSFFDREIILLRNLAINGGISLRNLEVMHRIDGISREEAKAEVARDIVHSLTAGQSGLLTSLYTVSTAIDRLEPIVGKKSMAIAQLGKISDRLKNLTDLARTQDNILSQYRDFRILPGADQRVPVNLAKVLENVSSIIAHRARAKNVKIKTEAASTDAVLRWNESDIYLIFLNILDNAVKFSRKNGRVHVTLSREGRGFRFVVRDFGVGIRPAIQPRIWEVSFSTPAPGSRSQTSGIGLPAVKQAVERIPGARIDFESQPNRFTEFIVFLPLNDETTP